VNLNFTSPSTTAPSFRSSTTFDVTADSTAPSVSATAIADQNATTAGFIHQGASYYVYANVSESGSGTASGPPSSRVKWATSSGMSSGRSRSGGSTR